MLPGVLSQITMLSMVQTLNIVWVSNYTMTSYVVGQDSSNFMSLSGDWSSLQVCSFYKHSSGKHLPKTNSGAGGFGTGLGQSGHIKTLWAIEWDEPAANTYRSVQMYGKFCIDD